MGQAEPVLSESIRMICPLCGQEGGNTEAARVYLIPSRQHRLGHCSACDSYFFDPLPEEEELTRFYSAAYYRFDPWHDRARGRIWARRLNRFKPTGRFLDVGCALGHFIDSIRERCGWEVAGLEFGADAAAFARNSLGLDVRSGELAQADFKPASFDFIHINNVVEHVRNPAALLDRDRTSGPQSQWSYFLYLPPGPGCIAAEYRVQDSTAPQRQSQARDAKRRFSSPQEKLAGGI